MITIDVKDYTIEQLKNLAYGLSCAQDSILKSKDCKCNTECTTNCRAYAICNDLSSAWQYLCKKIKEREAFELHEIQKETDK